MTKSSLYHFLFFLICFCNAEAMLHQLPATDNDMQEVAKKYPAVGIISCHYPIGSLNNNPAALDNHFTGTLINLPQCEYLKGRIVLCSQHCFSSWEDESPFFSFSLEGTENDYNDSLISSKIINFFPTPDLITDSWLKTLSFNLLNFSKNYTRDMGIAILEEPILCVEPMELYLDSLANLSGDKIVTTIGFGYNGRLDLGLITSQDKIKRGIQFLLKELKCGRGYFENPKSNNFPIYYSKPYDPNKPSEINLIRGQTFRGDSGGPVIINIDGQDKIIAVIQGAELKSNNISATYTVLIKCNWFVHNQNQINNNLNEIIYPDIDKFLLGNDEEIPEEIEKVANRKFHTNISREYFDSLIGARDWFLDFYYPNGNLN